MTEDQETRDYYLGPGRLDTLIARRRQLEAMVDAMIVAFKSINKGDSLSEAKRIAGHALDKWG